MSSKRTDKNLPPGWVQFRDMLTSIARKKPVPVMPTPRPSMAELNVMRAMAHRVARQAWEARLAKALADSRDMPLLVLRHDDA